MRYTIGQTFMKKDYEENPFGQGKKLRIVMFGLPGTPIHEVGSYFANFYDLDFFTIERMPDEINNYWSDKIPEVRFDTGDMLPGSESQQMDRDPSAAQYERDIGAVTPPLRDDPLSPEELEGITSSKSGIVVTEIADVGLVEWAKGSLGRWALVFLNADEKKAVAWMNKRRKCPSCQTSYHLEDHPPVVTGICNRCGTDLIKRHEDSPNVVRHQFNVWRMEFQPMLQAAGKNLIKLNLDDFSCAKDICNHLDDILIV